MAKRMGRKQAEQQIVGLWLQRPPEQRRQKDKEPFVTQVEAEHRELLRYLGPNSYQSVMALLLGLETDR
jgi:hypothetical protein